jgi:aminoglycoside phosphotransferase (APT) family kinase protein
MPTHLEVMPTRRALVEPYQEKTGFAVDGLALHHLFGMFRLAGIGPQV